MPRIASTMPARVRHAVAACKKSAALARDSRAAWTRACPECGSRVYVDDSLVLCRAALEYIADQQAQPDAAADTLELCQAVAREIVKACR